MAVPNLHTKYDDEEGFSFSMPSVRLFFTIIKNNIVFSVIIFHVPAFHVQPKLRSQMACDDNKV